MAANSESIVKIIDKLLKGIYFLVDDARTKVAIYLNAETTLLYWSIGNYIQTELKQQHQLGYGKQILATLSQQLTQQYSKGFTYY